MGSVVPIIKGEHAADQERIRRYKVLARDYSQELRRLREAKPYDFVEGFVYGLLVMLIVGWLW